MDSDNIDVITSGNPSDLQEKIDKFIIAKGDSNNIISMELSTHPIQGRGYSQYTVLIHTRNIE